MTKAIETLWRLLLMRISLQGLQIWICLIVMASQWKNYFLKGKNSRQWKQLLDELVNKLQLGAEQFETLR